MSTSSPTAHQQLSGDPVAAQSTAVEARPTRCWVEEISDENAFAALANEWYLLSEQCDDALLFTSHEWAGACWRHFHRGAAGRDGPRLCVLAVRDAIGLRAVVPLWLETRRFLGIRTRIAHFLGEGPSDYGDLLVVPPRRPVLEAIVEHLFASSTTCDLIDLREFIGESPNLPDLIELLRSRKWWIRQSNDSRCHLVPAGMDWESYYHGRFGADSCRYHRRDWRRLEKSGELTVELLTDVTRGVELSASFGEVQAAHRYASSERLGEFNDPTFRPFLEEMLATASQRGWLRLPALWRDGALLAYFITFLYNGRYYLYNTAYRADCRRFGVGKLLMLYMLEQFFAESGGIIDYLRGGEAYKDSWAERVLVNARIRAARPGVRPLIGRLVWFELMPMLQLRIPFLHRVLMAASAEGLSGIARRVLRRLLRTA